MTEVSRGLFITEQASEIMNDATIYQPLYVGADAEFNENITDAADFYVIGIDWNTGVETVVFGPDDYKRLDQQVAAFVCIPNQKSPPVFDVEPNTHQMVVYFQPCDSSGAQLPTRIITKKLNENSSAETLVKGFVIEGVPRAMSLVGQNLLYWVGRNDCNTFGAVCELTAVSQYDFSKKAYSGIPIQNQVILDNTYPFDVSFSLWGSFDTPELHVLGGQFFKINVQIDVSREFSGQLRSSDIEALAKKQNGMDLTTLKGSSWSEPRFYNLSYSKRVINGSDICSFISSEDLKTEIRPLPEEHYCVDPSFIANDVLASAVYDEFEQSLTFKFYDTKSSQVIHTKTIKGSKDLSTLAINSTFTENGKYVIRYTGGKSSEGRPHKFGSQLINTGYPGPRTSRPIFEVNSTGIYISSGTASRM